MNTLCGLVQYAGVVSVMYCTAWYVNRERNAVLQVRSKLPSPRGVDPTLTLIERGELQLVEWATNDCNRDFAIRSLRVRDRQGLEFIVDEAICKKTNAIAFRKMTPL